MKVALRNPWRRFGLLIFGIVVLVPGCRSATSPPAPSLPSWDASRAEVITWQSDDSHFDQIFALEASGLAASDTYLYITSEKYARLLLVEWAGDSRARVVKLEVPRHSELEGVALTPSGLLLCDEAHAAVHKVPIDSEGALVEESRNEDLRAQEIPMDGVRVQGGKIGFEGIEVDPENKTIFLLLERSGDDSEGCVSRIYRLLPEGDRLASRMEPLEIDLEDCAWRLTGLAWWQGTLLALKTQFPGERYEVVTVDQKTGETDVVLELTELLRSLESKGWSNNVEGITVTRDGALWLVADNAVTGVIDEPVPPRTDHGTLLLRIPVKAE